MLAAAGSRYTYSANTLAYPEALEGGAERIALVGMGCQASAPPVMAARKAGKVARRFALSIGLLVLEDLRRRHLPRALRGQVRPGPRADITKINIKGVFQIWMRDGGYHEVPLKEGHAWTREGCKTCPDFAAEHADISTGGIGAFSDWTLTIVRTDQGRDILAGMAADGVVETRPVDDDPGALGLLRKLAASAGGAGPADRACPMPGRLPATRSSHGHRPRRARAPASERARVEHGVEHGLGELPVKVFCWLGWYEHSTARPSGSACLDPVAEPGPGPQAELVGDHLVARTGPARPRPASSRSSSSSRARKGRHCVALARASACWPAGRTGRRR